MFSQCMYVLMFHSKGLASPNKKYNHITLTTTPLCPARLQASESNPDHPFKSNPLLDLPPPLPSPPFHPSPHLHSSSTLSVVPGTIVTMSLIRLIRRPHPCTSSSDVAPLTSPSRVHCLDGGGRFPR